MKRFHGFGLGFNQSAIRAMALGQLEASAPAGGEPDLRAALAPLSVDEVSDYQAWGVKEKALFIQGYQYLAVATAKELARPDGSEFNGFLTDGISRALEMLNVTSNYATSLGALSGTFDDLSKLVKDANDKLGASSATTVRKYRLLRDRIAWDLANTGITVQYDIVGDDPANPGVIYQRTVGENRAPDLAAVFSFKTPSEMYKAGKDLESRYADLGVQFGRAQLGAAGIFPILAALIVLIVGILMFFYLYWNHADRAKLDDKTASLVMGDANLSPAEKANILAKYKAADSWWGQLFGDFPWTTLIVTAGIALIAFFALPQYFAKRVSS